MSGTRRRRGLGLVHGGQKNRGRKEEGGAEEEGAEGGEGET